MPLESRKVSSALLKKGFRESSNAHHDKYWLYIGEKRQAIATYLSRGPSHSLSKHLCALMAKQLKLSAKEFAQLVDCTLDGPAYLATLRSQGVILE